MINYLQPGEPLTAAHWNELFAEAETVLHASLGDLSAVFAGLDKPFDRGFFFGFEPLPLQGVALSSIAVNFHPAAALFLRTYAGNFQSYQQGMYLRQYNHAAITAQLAGLSVSSSTAKWHVAKKQLPTWSAWLAAIYPAGLTGYLTGMNQLISSTTYAAYNCLDVSLQVHTVDVSGTPYNVTFKDVTTAEFANRFKPIDVFVLGDLTWSADWDKYRIVRVHNCGRTAAVVTFGGVAFTLAAAGSRCARRLDSGDWILCGQFFHTMEEGDGRFLQMGEANGSRCSLFAPAVVQDVVTAALKLCVSNLGKERFVGKFWDAAATYNNAAYEPMTAHEKAPPTGGYFPVPDASLPVGDLIVPRGKVLLVDPRVPVTTTMSCLVVSSSSQEFSFRDGVNVITDPRDVSVKRGVTDIPEWTDGNPALVNWQVANSKIVFIVRGSLPSPPPPFISTGETLTVTFTYTPLAQPKEVEFTGFANLATMLADSGIRLRTVAQDVTGIISGVTSITNKELYGDTEQHIVDLASALAMFLTGGSAPWLAAAVGFTAEVIAALPTPEARAAAVKSRYLPLLLFGAAAMVETTGSTNFSFWRWKVNSSGVPVLDGTATVTLNRKVGTASQKRNLFVPENLLSAVQDWVKTTGEAGGILSVANFRVGATAFGHVLLWEESWPLDARFNGVMVGGSYNSFGSFKLVKTLAPSSRVTPFVRVTRAAFLNESRYYGSFGTGDPNPWEHGVFPPIGVFSNGAAARALFWHFPRLERTYEDSRWYYHDPADSAWMPDSGWSHARLNTSVLRDYDNLTTDGFNHVKSFYEATPIGFDEIMAGPAVHAKTGLRVMGAFKAAADYSIPLAGWYAKRSAITYPTGSGTGTIGLSINWYNGAKTQILAAAAISQPLRQVLTCQFEHYNLLASALNGVPSMRLKLPAINALGGNVIGRTAFTLNFAAANIIIVDGGIGHTVGELLNFNLKVAAVDGDGAITAVAQNGSVVVNSYDAYSTPRRPFVLAPTGIGDGRTATCDTSSGDGSGLNFIPTYAPIGVPTPVSGVTSLLTSKGVYGWSKIFPRQAFFAWNGAVPGAADPVGDYLATLGLTIQATLPDGYGAPVRNRYGKFVAGNYQTEDGGLDVAHGGLFADYCQSFNPALETAIKTYRWINIPEARAYYDAAGLPFLLEQDFAPMRWVVQEAMVGGVKQEVTTDISGRQDLPPEAYGPPYTGFVSTNFARLNFFRTGFTDFAGLVNGASVAAGETPTSFIPRNLWASSYFGPVDMYQNIPANRTHVQDTVLVASVWGDIDQGRFGITAAEFVNDAEGDWLCDSNVTTLARDRSMVNTWNQYASRKSYFVEDYVTTITGDYTCSGIPFSTWYQTRTTTKYLHELDWGILNSVKFGVQTSPLVARAYLREGLQDLMVAVLPQNLAYRDTAFVRNQEAAYAALGMNVVPYVADNTIEGVRGEFTIVDGGRPATWPSGVPYYYNDVVVTTGLMNARLVAQPVDESPVVVEPASAGAGGLGGAGGGSPPDL